MANFKYPLKIIIVTKPRSVCNDSYTYTLVMGQLWSGRVQKNNFGENNHFQQVLNTIKQRLMNPYRHPGLKWESEINYRYFVDNLSISPFWKMVDFVVSYKIQKIKMPYCRFKGHPCFWLVHDNSNYMFSWWYQLVWAKFGTFWPLGMKAENWKFRNSSKLKLDSSKLKLDFLFKKMIASIGV